jgi:hypothetical protein
MPPLVATHTLLRNAGERFSTAPSSSSAAPNPRPPQLPPYTAALSSKEMPQSTAE